MIEILILVIIGVFFLLRKIKFNNQRNEFEKIKKYGEQINRRNRENKKI